MRSILTALQDGRLFELPEAGKDRALEFLARVLDANPDIVVGTDTVEEIKQREQECNTGIGMGVAVPHVRAKREDGELFCAIGWSPQGIDYGAPDGKQVHMVFMYYIPGALKNIYLKEISILVKAMKKTGGIEPIAHADSLFVVRNLLLDWVSEVSNDSGPEAVARMIKLEARQGLVPPTGPTSAVTVPTVNPPAGAPVSRPTQAMAFSVVLASPNQPLVLAQESDWVTSLERDGNWLPRLLAGQPFSVAGRQVFLTGTNQYAGGRTIFHCVALPQPA
jgi:nitrogen PTS system EIIA component